MGADFPDCVGLGAAERLQQFFGLALELVEIGVFSERAGGK